MNPAPKTPFFCFKSPFANLQQQQSPQEQSSTNHCSWDTPWLLKPLLNLGTAAANLFNSANSTGNPLQSSKQKQLGFSSAEEEQRSFAAALASGKEATVLEFYSPNCRLCNSLVTFVNEVGNRNADWLSIAFADAESDQWLPELLHYDIKYVPCFVLLDKQGKALAKTGVPNSRLHVIAGISHLLKLKRPQKP